MNADIPGSQNKFRRYRAAKKARGLKEIRMWLPDVYSAEFKSEMARAAKELNGSQSEREAMEFIEAVMADTMKDEPPY